MGPGEVSGRFIFDHVASYHRFRSDERGRLHCRSGRDAVTWPEACRIGRFQPSRDDNVTESFGAVENILTFRKSLVCRFHDDWRLLADDVVPGHSSE